MVQYSEYCSRLKNGKTGLLAPILLGGNMESQSNVLTTRQSRRRLKEIGSSDDEALFEDEIQEPKRPALKRIRTETDHLYSSESYLKENAKNREVLVPIKIEFEVDDFRVEDTFTWNLNEKLTTPEMFAEIMCKDLELPIGAGMANEYISASIHEQLIHYNELLGQLEKRQEAEKSNNRADPELRVSLNLEVILNQLVLRDQVEWDLSTLPVEQYSNTPADTTTTTGSKNEVCIEKNNQKLEYTKTPEYFAKVLCADLGIGGEFIPLISNSIREQLLRLQKERLELISQTEQKMKRGGSDYPGEALADTKPLHDSSSVATPTALGNSSENGSAGVAVQGSDMYFDKNSRSDWYSEFIFKQKPLDGILRPPNEISMWGPTLEVLSTEELDRLLLGQERNKRFVYFILCVYTFTGYFVNKSIIIKEKKERILFSCIPFIPYNLDDYEDQKGVR
ncbi:Chromatin structure-remodeling complex subunit sfh1 [Zancudomyces culisetae]|uniref:Chromatin structure-remodeling complex subunit sfh1 n=1 Tax=Zancudomyces culisetae TaxID=1213189 RepID=A0A1R1PUB6_ZANCU|nr:Chromatin structure-remodeling complex subunit sfh1 [Zancudomyces culisetae]|eukprot:OMH84568.1 Chromatin structure-remodeling complex subunit sfh1 [Zancudomyces culisetae]